MAMIKSTTTPVSQEEFLGLESSAENENKNFYNEGTQIADWSIEDIQEIEILEKSLYNPDYFIQSIIDVEDMPKALSRPPRHASELKELIARKKKSKNPIQLSADADLKEKKLKEFKEEYKYFYLSEKAYLNIYNDITVNRASILNAFLKAKSNGLIESSDTIIFEKLIKKLSPEQINVQKNKPSIIEILSKNNLQLSKNSWIELLNKTENAAQDFDKNTILIAALRNEENFKRLDKDIWQLILEKSNVNQKNNNGVDAFNMIVALAHRKKEKVESFIVDYILEHINLVTISYRDRKKQLESSISRFEELMILASVYTFTDDQWQNCLKRSIIDRERPEKENSATTALAIALAVEAKMPDFVWNELFGKTNNNITNSFANYIIDYDKYSFKLSDEVFKKASENISESTLGFLILNSHKLPTNQDNILLENVKNSTAFSSKIYEQLLIDTLNQKLKINTEYVKFLVSRLNVSQSDNLTQDPLILAIKNNQPKDIIFAIIDKLPENSPHANIHRYINISNFESGDIFYKMLNKFNVNAQEYDGHNVLSQVFAKGINLKDDELLKLIKKTQLNAVNRNNQTALYLALKNNVNLTPSQWELLVNKSNSKIKPRNGISCKQLLSMSTSNIPLEQQKMINSYYTQKFLRFVKSLNVKKVEKVEKFDWYEPLSEKIEGKSINDYQVKIEALLSTMKQINASKDVLTIEDRVNIEEEYPKILDSLYDKSTNINLQNEAELKIVLNILKENVDKIYTRTVKLETNDLKSIRRFLEATK